MRGGHASKADYGRLAAGRPENALLARWGKFRRLFVDEHAESFADDVDGWVSRLGSSPTAFAVADIGYLWTKMGRWGSAISRPGVLARHITYPFLDNRVVSAVFALPTESRLHDRLIHAIVQRLAPDLVDVPIAYDHWKLLPADKQAREKEQFPLAYVPRWTGSGSNTDWRVNWLALLPEFARQYHAAADDGLRAMLKEEEILRLLDGDAQLNDRYLLFSIYAATIVRSGGLLRPPEAHPIDVPLSIS